MLLGSPHPHHPAVWSTAPSMLKHRHSAPPYLLSSDHPALQTPLFPPDEIWPVARQLPPSPDEPLSLLLFCRGGEAYLQTDILHSSSTISKTMYVCQTGKCRKEFFTVAGSKNLSPFLIPTLFSVHMLSAQKFYFVL